jgi:RNA recognition motif-containing protein
MATDKGATTEEMNLSSTTLFVRNLPFVYDNKELEKVFSEVGPVKRCFVVKDKGTLPRKWSNGGIQKGRKLFYIIFCTESEFY